MEELRIPTRRVTAEIFLRDGSVSLGCLFHAESLYEHGTAEDIAAELNDERDFVPFQEQVNGARLQLLNKQHMLRVRVPELHEADLTLDLTDEIEDVDSCTLWLADGSQVSCRPVVETPVASSRLIDKLNHTPLFMTVITDDGVEFVRAAHIVRIIGNR
jgi:hypothetical protein